MQAAHACENGPCHDLKTELGECLNVFIPGVHHSCLGLCPHSTKTWDIETNGIQLNVQVTGCGVKLDHNYVTL
ncbi:MAG: hypothetical protein K2X39_05920 [Silvanigrellaceae bacterium]|nr:hypothetical protein [Silvanigrellaceae bacterium]